MANLKFVGPQGEIEIDISSPGEIKWGGRRVTKGAFDQLDEKDLIDIKGSNPNIRGTALCRVNHIPRSAKVNKKESVRILWVEHNTKKLKTCILTILENSLRATYEMMVKYPFRDRIFKRGKDCMLYAAPNSRWENLKEFSTNSQSLPNFRSKPLDMSVDELIVIVNQDGSVDNIEDSYCYESNKQEIDRFKQDTRKKLIERYSDAYNNYCCNLNDYNYSIQLMEQVLDLKILGR